MRRSYTHFLYLAVLTAVVFFTSPAFGQSYRTLDSSELPSISESHLPTLMVFIPSGTSQTDPMQYTLGHLHTRSDKRSPFHFLNGRLRLKIVYQEQSPKWWKLFEVIHRSQLTISILDNRFVKIPERGVTVRNVPLILRGSQIKWGVSVSNRQLQSELAKQLAGDLVEYSQPQQVNGLIRIRYGRCLGWRLRAVATAPIRWTAALVDRYKGCSVPYGSDNGQVPTVIITDPSNKFNFNNQNPVAPEPSPLPELEPLDPNDLYGGLLPQDTPQDVIYEPIDSSGFNWTQLYFLLIGLGLGGFGAVVYWASKREDETEE